MSRESISEDVKRKLYAESMGRCMWYYVKISDYINVRN